MKTLRCFIGFDERQKVAYTVAAHSLAINATKPVSITPLVLETLPTELRGLTPFTFTRFLVPWLCDYQGWALFMDADVLVAGDVAELFALADPEADCMVVDHAGDKAFERASVMLMNCSRLRHMTPDWLNEKPAGLMTLQWSALPGALPAEWNHLVGYDEPNPDAKIVHYTQGVPIHPEIEGCEWSDEYIAMLSKDALTTADWTSLMGQSKHAIDIGGRMVPRLKMVEPREVTLS